MILRKLLSVSAFVGLAVSATVAPADPRSFTFVYDTYPVGKGNAEYEQWVTYNTHREEDKSFSDYRLRHELEYGVTDKFDVSLYFASWRYEETDDHTGTRFDSSSVEGIYYLSNPVTDAIGVGLYAEFGVGENSLEFEQKLLLQKDINRWTLAYNFVVETELEGLWNNKEEDETEGVLGHTFGVSYALTPTCKVGGEGVVESIFEDWTDYEDTTVYAGPNVSYQGGKNWWVTVTPMIQLTGVDDEARYTVRVIAGLEF